MQQPLEHNCLLFILSQESVTGDGSRSSAHLLLRGANAQDKLGRDLLLHDMCNR